MALKISVLSSGNIVCPPDWGVAVTGCQYHRLYIKRGGRVMCVLPETSFALEDDTLYLFPAFSPYRLAQEAGDPFRVLWFHVVSMPVLTRGLLILPLGDKPLLGAAIAVLEALVPYTFQDVDGTKDPLLEPALELLFEALGRETPLSPCHDTRIAQVLVRLLQDDGGWVAMDALAALAGMESHYFSRVFHREVGLSVKEYQLHLRMQRAMALLRQEMKVGEVAQIVGYEDEKSFSRAFNKAVGATPSGYRKSYLRQV